MRPGDLVEFKEGLFGLKAPDNCGILLERRKEGKKRVLVLYTVKGRKEVGKDRLGGMRLATGLTGDEPDEELSARLDELIGDLAEAREVPPRETGDRELWELLVQEAGADAGPDPDEGGDGAEDGDDGDDGEGADADPARRAWTAEEAAKRLFDLRRPTPDHLARVREALQSCGPGVGYFRRDGAAWRPLPPAVVEAARRDVEGLKRLRNRLVRVETAVDGEGFERRVHVAVEEPDLGEDDRRLLEDVVAPYMRDVLLHDADRGRVVLGGPPDGEEGSDVVAIDGFSLLSYAKHLARDATGQEGTSVASTYAAFLLRYGLDTLEDVYERIVRRWVLESPFDWEVPELAVRAAGRLEAFDQATHGGPEDRTDLRHLDTVTIDPPDARDFDDAVSLTGDALWVHIADVSRYVVPDSTMDAEAARRGTSVYLPTRVLPMLPPRLADDLCSLKAGEDRPAVSVKLPLDLDAGEEGRSFEPEFHVATIHVDDNLSYDEVDAWIEEGAEPYAALSALAERWLAAREGLAIETTELRVGLGDAGVETTTKRATPATRLIEAFMVAANEAVARVLTERDVPLPYRCHPLPDRAGIETFNGQAQAMGLDVAVEVPGVEAGAEGEDGKDGDGPGGPSGRGGGGTRAATTEAEEEDLLEALKSGGKLSIGFAGGGPGPADEADGTGEGEEGGEGAAGEEGDREAGPPMQGLAQLTEEERRAWLEPFQRGLDTINALDDDRLKQVANGKLLACLGRALYLEQNVGHFGLGSTCYLHFTSPIRRYPDLLVHRQLKATLAGEDTPYTREDLSPRCQRSTEHAIEAERLEWSLKDVALVFRSRDEGFSGVQTGVVNGLTGGGAFVTLEGGLEARIPVQAIPGGPLDVDEHQARLLDRDGEAVLTLGQAVAVRLTGRDLVEGKLACELARVGRVAEEDAPAGPADGTGDGAAAAGEEE